MDKFTASLMQHNYDLRLDNAKLQMGFWEKKDAGQYNSEAADVGSAVAGFNQFKRREMQKRHIEMQTGVLLLPGVF